MTADKIVNGIGAILVLLGIAIILTPWIIFPVCEIEGSSLMTPTGIKLPVACDWIARAETGFGALIVVAGGFLKVRSSAKTWHVVGIFSRASGALVMLIPTVLIGMCKMAAHSCRMRTPSRTGDWWEQPLLSFEDIFSGSVNDE